jgi:hypothetical protein
VIKTLWQWIKRDVEEQGWKIGVFAEEDCSNFIEDKE